MQETRAQNIASWPNGGHFPEVDNFFLNEKVELAKPLNKMFDPKDIPMLTLPQYSASPLERAWHYRTQPIEA